jgi:hypothetical protein
LLAISQTFERKTPRNTVHGAEISRARGYSGKGSGRQGGVWRRPPPLSGPPRRAWNKDAAGAVALSQPEETEMSDPAQTPAPEDGPEPRSAGQQRPDQGDGVKTPAQSRQDPATGGEGAAGAGGSGGFGT